MKKGQKKKIKKKRIVCNIDFELIQKTTGKREEKRREEKRVGNLFQVIYNHEFKVFMR